MNVSNPELIGTSNQRLLAALCYLKYPPTPSEANSLDSSVTPLSNSSNLLYSNSSSSDNDDGDDATFYSLSNCTSSPFTYNLKHVLSSKLLQQNLIKHELEFHQTTSTFRDLAKSPYSFILEDGSLSNESISDQFRIDNNGRLRLKSHFIDIKKNFATKTKSKIHLLKLKLRMVEKPPLYKTPENYMLGGSKRNRFKYVSTKKEALDAIRNHAPLDYVFFDRILINDVQIKDSLRNLRHSELSLQRYIMSTI